MAGEHYAHKAVVGMAAYIRSGIAAKLRALELEQGLDVNSLTDPAVVIEANVPLDNRSFRYEVYTETGLPHPEAGQRRKLHVWDITVAYTFTGDADVEAGTRFLMRQHTALQRLIEADPSLGGTVVAAYEKGVEFERDRGDSSVIKHEFAMGFEVHTHDP